MGAAKGQKFAGEVRDTALAATLAGQMLDSGAAFAVVDAAGRRVGALDTADLIRVLTNMETAGQP